ncbi:hypothetical protein [Amycolatopsis sp. NPDC004378]
MAEPNPAENGHQFHFTVDIQGAHRVGDGPYVDEEQPAGLPFTVTVRAWNLRDACIAAAALSLADWTQPDENGAGSFELLDAAAERGHNAMFEGELAADGIERDLWHKVVLAVLADPQLLSHWARAARIDADNWHRQCRDLDAELEEWRSTAKSGTRAGWVLSRVREALGTPDGRAVSVHAAEVRAERDAERQTAVAMSDAYRKAVRERDQMRDAVLALCDTWWRGKQGEVSAGHTFTAIRAALQGDQPTEQPVRPRFSGPMEPVHPCRQIPTRHCPAVYDDVCGDRPCARFESEDETPWLPELPAAKRPAEPDVTPPDPSGRIVDGGPVQPFTDTDHEVPHA